MKFLGIDYGTKRVGVALSDEGGKIAFPKAVILNDKDLFEKIGSIIKKEKVEEIVVGDSTDHKMEPNFLAARIEIFIEELKNKFKLSVSKQKEFLTTFEARKSGTSKKDRDSSQAHTKIKEKRGIEADSSAAALILQRYLDKNNNNKIAKK